jgi:hypothetical protein
MPIKRSWGIKPGGGKKANEFDDLDLEDKQIAEAEEKKAQAGIPPGSDHPLVVSHKHEAIKASKDKASLDMKFGEEKEIEMAKLNEENLKLKELSKDIKLSEATKWPGMEIDVESNEIEWFMKTFRLKPFAQDVDIPVEKLGVLYDPREVKKELQAIYHARHEMIGKSELERRDIIIGHYEEYAKAMASTKPRVPRHFVRTEYLPLIRMLTSKELEALEEKQRMELITSKHSEFSQPFRAFRDYLVFLIIFLAFLYCSFSTDRYEIRSKLTSQLSATNSGFPDVTTTTKLQTWIDDTFLDLFYPETSPNGQSLTCQQKQYLSDGVNLKIGNVRIRQIRVGKSDIKKPWNQDKVSDEYSTCIVPSLFKNAMGRRCFRTWGGSTFPEEMSNLYRGIKWKSELQLDTTEYYSVLSRLKWPGSGYAKLIANDHDMAQEDFNSLFEKTWIDIQTRAVFIEANLLNVPTSFISTVRLLVQYGAEGEILSTVDIDSSGIYRYHRALQIARANFFSNLDILLPGFFVLLVTIIITGYICSRILIISLLPTIVISLGMGLCFMWWGMSFAYATIEKVEISYFLMPALEFLVYSCIFFQGILEIRFLRRATKSGDRFLRLCFYDTYNTLHLINLLFWFTCFCMRLSSFSSLYERLDSFQDAIVQPCFKNKVTYNYANNIGSYTEVEADAWAAAPDGCYGTLETTDDGATSLNYGYCPSDATARSSAKCCAEVGFVSLFWPMNLDIWVRQLMAFNAFLLCVRFFKFVRMFNSLALFTNTLTEAVVRVGHLAVIIILIMTAFSVSFHLAFGFADQSYRDFPEAVKTLFEILLGAFDVDSLRKINPYLAPVFFYLYVLIIVMVVLSMFVAVVNNAYEGVREHLAEPEYCFFRDVLWHFCVDSAEKEPINSQHELFHRMSVSKHFLRDPGTHTISDSDRAQLKDSIRMMSEYANGKGLERGEPLPKFFPFRRPDGRSVDGTTTDVLIKNSELFRAVLSEKSGADNFMMVNDFVHVYWSFLQLPPLCWILKMKSFPGRAARWLFPTVEKFKKKFEGAEEEGEGEGRNNDDEEDDDVSVGESLAEKRHMQNDDDMFLVKSGLSSAQIDLLHQFEEPKLSLMRGMSKSEEGQKRVLHAMELLMRTATEYKELLRKTKEAKAAAAVKEAKKLALEEAEREAKAIRENPDLASRKKAAVALQASTVPPPTGTTETETKKNDPDPPAEPKD